MHSLTIFSNSTSQHRTLLLNIVPLSNSALLVALLLKTASERNLPGTDRFWRHFFHPTWPSSGPVLSHLRPQKSVPARQVRTCLPHFPQNLSNSVFFVHFCSRMLQNRNLPGTDPFRRHLFHSTWPFFGPVLTHLRPQESVPARQVRTCSPHIPLNLSNSALLESFLFKAASESQSAWHEPIPAAPFPLNLALCWSCPAPSAPSGIRPC